MRRLPAIVVALLAASIAVAQAQPYPSRPVRIIVAVSAGGGVDTVTRIVADQVSRRLGQPFVVENKAGASGNIAADAVFRAEPDGYTLLSTPPNVLATNEASFKKLNFDPSGFEPVAVMSRFPNTMVVRPDFPARTVQEAIAYFKANPSKLNYGSAGVGGTPHLTAELFMAVTGTRLTHVPYKGVAPALTDLMAGQVDLVFVELSTAYGLHRSGRAKILAVAADKRADVIADVPTFTELGLPIVSYAWNAISAPPRTPSAVTAALNKAVNDVLHEPDIRTQLARLNIEPVGGTTDEMRDFVVAERRRWSEVIRAAGLQPQ
jgi:tripartite-type tricarboxylate transporter receptor subunit TctC